MGNVRAIEVGYGTLTYTSVDAGADGKVQFKSFSSVVAPTSQDDLSGGFAKRDTVRVCVGTNYYEVGPDAELQVDRTSTRVLSSSYIDSDQYRALFLGALALMDTEIIDLLVLALPVSNMQRSNELKAFAMGTHTINGKTYEVRDVWVLSQPLAGYLAHAHDIGQEAYNELKESNVLSLDFGFSTVDWLTSRGLRINDRRSGAVDMGMSAVLESVQGQLKPHFPHLDVIPLGLIDLAFWKHPGTIKISGKTYAFPKNTEDNPFDVQPAIEKVTSAALHAVRNNVGAGAEIDAILVMGGSHGVYLPQVQKAFPTHLIKIVKDPLTAVCRGMYYGGIQYLQAKQRKVA